VLSVAVLGAVEVRRDGVLVPVPVGKTTELLVRLALDAGAPVRTDLLVEDLWGEPVERNTLQSKVSRLRSALGGRDLVPGSGDAYRLVVDRSAIDAFRVVELAAGAAAARTAGDAALAVDRANEGLGLFRGEALVDAGDWAHPHRARLDEVRMGLLEDLMAARLDLGSGGEVVGELGSLVERNPLREGPWALLITALYRAGRQAEALAAYTRVRTLLRDQLGIEPGARLRALERQVLQQSPMLGPATEGPPVAVPGNLPTIAASFVGRETDTRELASLLGSHRLVTVVGPAGVGKTRLAIEAGRGLSAAGGVWLVRLEAVGPAVDLSQLVAETLHVAGGRRSLLERLAGAETVLVLDNCEHLVVGVAELVGSLLVAVPHLRIVATSQVPLGVDAECVDPIEPLTSEHSVTLFVGRARAMRRHLVLDADTTALVEEVCRSLDGLPLAIELAAARVRSLSVRDIARRLDDRFALLADPTSGRPPRSRALASAIAWSYDLLFPDDQRGLWALACFPGGASLDATQRVLVALGVPVASVLDTISRLVARSMVALDVAPDGSVRYRMLDSIRAYAMDRLQEAGQAEVGAAAHAAWCADTAAWCDAHVRGERQTECLSIARAERANIDAALAWCSAHHPELGAVIANGFGWTWVVLGDGTAGAARIRGAVAPSTPARDRAAGLLIAGWLEASAGNVDRAEADLRSALDLADGLGDAVLRADTERHRAFLGIQQGSPQDVLACAAASLATYRPLSLPWETAGALILAAYGWLMMGDTAIATECATEATDLLAPIGDSWALVHAGALLGGIAQAEHRFDDASAAFTRAALESRRLGFVGQAALHLASLARVQQRTGAVDEAAASFDQAIALARTSGDGRLAATARLNLARLRRATGDHREARHLLEENDRWYDRAGGGDGALLNRCLLHAEKGDVPALTGVLDDARAAGNAEVEVYALDALAAAAAAAGDRGRARRLLDAAESLASAAGHLVDDDDRLDGARTRELLAPAD
jgi:predicted ATPase/DNA-binding SARP family transcriptional activator/tetratricopeptide (TPR) repeat protein